MAANRISSQRTTVDRLGAGRGAHGASGRAVRRRGGGAGVSATRRGLAPIGEREIAALLRQLEGEEEHEATEGGREEVIDPGFDDMPGTWEALGLANGGFHPCWSRPAMIEDVDDAW